ncbi:MAG: alpha/beta fold hydrolase [Brucellaceae bacterium]|nr:alpha/beta fold hydrolase [Brucellaceae bacterium]
MAEAFRQAVDHALKGDTAAALFSEQAALASRLTEIVAGETPEVARTGDRRFADPLWTENPLFRMSLLAYQAWAQASARMSDAFGLDDASSKRLRILSTMMTDMLAPTNTLAGNPAAMRRAMETGGMSLLEGMRNFMADMVSNRGMPSQVDRSKYQVGGNLAVTSGSVVLRTALFELIRYAPVSATVRSVPLLVVPSMINKFYALDLAPGRSFVEYMRDRGIQVFIISWKNPDADAADWGFSTYAEAVDEAYRATCDLAGTETANVLSVCAGGMVSSAFAARRAALGQRQPQSLTLVVTMLDNAMQESTLGLFATGETVDAARRLSRAQGFVDGRDLASTFAWLRPNELVWSYWVNNYLMGNPPPAFDILYWNSDCTRLPARLHAGLLETGLDNAFARKGGVVAGGVPVDLGAVTSDLYVLAGATDHICPWQNAYQSLRLFSGAGSSAFVLANSGHVQSFINPPGNPKSTHHVAGDLSRDAEGWLETATRREGSFWEHWVQWVLERSGAEVPAPASPGNNRYPVLCAAPGTYVHEQ